MASDKQKFAHITVEPEDDDEFVVQAGIPQDDASSERGIETLTSEGDSDADEGVQCAEEVEQTADDFSTVDIDDSDAVKPTESAYKTNSEEDLNVPPMSAMQKGIIVFAVVMIVVAIVYYLAFMN